MKKETFDSVRDFSKTSGKVSPYVMRVLKS